MSSHRILIVDDDDDFRLIYRFNTKTALSELQADGLSVEAVIDVAANYDQAMEILDKRPVDLLSLDIAFSRAQEGQADRLIQGDFGGIALLKKLHASGKHPLTILVSGETFSVSQVGQLQKYGVLKHYHKDTSTTKIRSAFKAALTYLVIVADLKESNRSSAQDAWKLLMRYAHLADLSLDSFPSNLADQMHMAV